ncbi:hypothetical protein GCM10012275_64070 [Longimycelium tulufanense]|uniref:Uncharacterized protein n=1 Tax=Longimycelium tulufanense TaxID=907463 RepID=A0A8J3CF74_9PSEU|nr:hypothetical protein GCM10012275_64070 [Longimycelium tulufanense]
MDTKNVTATESDASDVYTDIVGMLIDVVGEDILLDLEVGTKSVSHLVDR